MNDEHYSDLPFPRRGLTLVESAVSMVIVGIVLVAALQTVGASARSRQIQKETDEHHALAADLMNEILQARYQEPKGGSMTWENDGTTTVINEPMPPLTPTFGPEPDELDGTRRTFDDVDDYNNWVEKPPQTKNGIAISGKTGWKRQVKVQYADPATLNGNMSGDQGLKMITVTITDPSGKTTQMVGLRWKSGLPDQLPGTVSTYVGWMGVELQTGEMGSDRLTTETNLLNRPPE